MKIIKFLFSKSVMINYFIQITIPIILVIIFMIISKNKLSIENIIFGYNNANSLGLSMVRLIKSGIDYNRYIDLFCIITLKFIIVLLYVKIIGEENRKTLLAISITTSILGTIIGYIFLELMVNIT